LEPHQPHFVGAMTRVPVILDTDIGDDIDDAWALSYLLAHPSCDLRLVVTTYGDRERHLVRAAVVREFLARAGRPGVPVALGVPAWGREGASRPDCGQLRWAEAARSEGGARPHSPPEEDGVGAMIRVLEGSSEPVTILSIGPLGNVAALLDRAGDGIAARARLTGMQGSIFRGYSGGEPPSAEHNVACNPAACARALAAPWCQAPLIAPLDTCMAVELWGAPLQRLHSPESPALVRALLGANSSWLRDSAVATKYYGELDPRESTTVLFDTLAAYLALQPDGGGLLDLRALRLQVAEDGRTLLSDGEGAEVVCAVEWREGGLGKFAEHLVDTLTRHTAGAGPTREPRL